MRARRGAAEPRPKLSLALEPSTYPTPCDLGLILGPLDGWSVTVFGFGLGLGLG